MLTGSISAATAPTWIRRSISPGCGRERSSAGPSAASPLSVDRPARGDGAASPPDGGRAGVWPAPPRSTCGRRTTDPPPAFDGRYDIALARRLAMIRELLPDAAIGSDVIAGSPVRTRPPSSAPRARRGITAHVPARLFVLRPHGHDRGQARRPERRRRDHGTRPPPASRRRTQARELHARLRRRRGGGPVGAYARAPDRCAPRLHTKLYPRPRRRTRQLVRPTHSDAATGGCPRPRHE